MGKLIVGRLYLSKEKDKHVFVDYHTKLPQHQLDGIRFLYRQFKKKESGLILNDPSGYGKCVQTVLFLEAVQSVTVDKPVLILCEDHSVNTWKQHFEKWTNINDLAVQLTNPYKKNRVFINPISDAQLFVRRSWSVVIIHDNLFSKDRFQTTFNADFKIWISSLNMKENLNIFSLINEWIRPNSKFNIEDFKAKNNTIRERIDKAILLDAFLEDIVLRRDNFQSPFKVRVQDPKTPVKESPKKVSRKNKDPTGTKVKRSKRRIIEDDDDINILTNRETVEQNVKTETNRSDPVPVVELKNQQKNQLTVNRDVNSFIDNHEPIENNESIELKQTEEGDSNDSSDLFTQSNTFNAFQNALNELIENENNVPALPDNSIMDIDNNEVAEVPNKTKDYVIETAPDSMQIDVEYATKSPIPVDIQTTTKQEMEKDYAVKEYPELKKEKASQVEETASSNNANATNKNELVNKETVQTSLKKSEDDKRNTKSEASNDFLTDLEKKLLMKYKGSLLDSIFN